MRKPNFRKALTVTIAIVMVLSAVAILSFVAQPSFGASSGTVTYDPTTLGVTPSVSSFYDPTSVAQATASSGQSIEFATLFSSQAFYQFNYINASAALVIAVQVGFGGSTSYTQYASGWQSITSAAAYDITADGPSVTGLSDISIVVTSLSLQAAGTPSSVTFYVTGTYNSQPFTSTSVTETSIGSTASTFYYGYAALSGVYGGASSPIQTVGFVSGGTFSSGSTVYFYLSTTDSATGLVETSGSHYDPIAVTTLTSTSPTTLNQAITFFPGGMVVTGPTTTAVANTLAPGTYYILASGQNPSEITSPSALTSYAFPASATQFVFQTADLKILNALDPGAGQAIGDNALLVGGTGIAYGTGWDAGASITVTLSYPGGTVLVTATATAFGLLEATFTVPQLAGTYGTPPQSSYLGTGSTSLAYTVVAQEMNTYSSSYPQGGITADSSFDVAPVLTVSPIDFSGAAGTTLTLTGTGFPGGASMSGSTSTTPSGSIEITALGDTSPVETGTYHSAVTVSSTGQFSVTVTTTSKVSTTGPFAIYIQMTDSAPYETSINELFSPAVFISAPNPQAPMFYFNPVSIGGHYYPTLNSLTAAVLDFPADTTVSIYIDSTLLSNVTTDSNGFAMSSVTTLPAMPSGSYVVTAVDSSLGLVAVPDVSGHTVGSSTGDPLILSPFFEVTDPSGNLLATDLSTYGEYAPQNATFTFWAYGFSPGTEYSPVDNWAAGVGGPIATYGTNVTAMVGTIAPDGAGFVPASNGTFVFSYQPFYGYYGITTGTFSQIEMGSYYTLGTDMGYLLIGAPEFTVSPQIQRPTYSAEVTVTNLIDSALSSTLYPGTSTYYNLYIGSSEIIAISGKSVFTASDLSGTITFVIPSIPSGLYNISVVYAGQPVSQALSPLNNIDAMIVVSTPSSSFSSGSIQVVAGYDSGAFQGYLIVGYGLIGGTAADMVIYTSTGSVKSTYVSSTGSDGAFFDYQPSDLGPGSTILGSDSAGTYGVVLTVAPGTLSTSEFYATYTVVASLDFSTTLSSPAGYSGGVFQDYVTDIVTLVAGGQMGLVPGAFYDLYFGGQYMETIQALTSTSFGTGVTFMVPVVINGTYYVNLTKTGTSKVVASAPFVVLSSPTLTLLTDSGYAFPGQIVYFDWTPTGNMPNMVGGEYGPVDVTAYLNGTAYTTFPATFDGSAISGSFQMPNAPVGTFWLVTLGWTQSYNNNAYSNVVDITPSVTTISVTKIAPINASESAAFSVPLGEVVQSINSLSLTISPTPTTYIVNITSWYQAGGTSITVFYSLYILPSSISTISVTPYSAAYTYDIANQSTVSATGLSISLPSTSTTSLTTNTVAESDSFTIPSGQTVLTVSSIDFSSVGSQILSEHTNVTGWYQQVSDPTSLVVNFTISYSASATGTVTGPQVAYTYASSGTGTAGVTANLGKAFAGDYAAYGTVYLTLPGITVTDVTSVGDYQFSSGGSDITVIFSNITGWYFDSSSHILTVNTSLLYYQSTDGATITTSSVGVSYTYLAPGTVTDTGTSYDLQSTSTTTVSVATIAATTTFSIPAGETVQAVSSIGDLTVTSATILGTNITGWYQPVNDPTNLVVNYTVTYSASASDTITTVGASYTFLVFGREITFSVSSEPDPFTFTPTYAPLVLAESATFTSVRMVELVTSITLDITGASSWYANVTGWTQDNTTHVVTVYFSLVIHPTSSSVGISSATASIEYPSIGLVKGFTQLTIYGAYLQLISGNGALLTGINSTQIATLVTSVNNAVTTSMSVPLAELNASVASINGLTAEITTSFGNMTSTLAAINATVSAIESGQVIVETYLGSISTSLSSLNSSIVALHGLVVQLNTTLGPIQTTLNGINATVTSNANGISSLKGSTVTITSDLGTIKGKVSGIQNGTATIETDLGGLQANVSSIKTTTHSLPTFEIFLIVIIVLALIAIAVGALSLSSSNRVSRKLEEQFKK